jgi:F-type H+-transporting ATPase subunit epsilon
MKSFRCDIVSAETRLYSGALSLLIVNGALGELGIAPGHAPLLTSIVPGPVRLVKEDGQEEIFYLSGGILEVQPDVVSVLADSALRAKDLDEAKLLEAKKAAEAVLNDKKSEIDYGMASAHFIEVAAQLRTLEQIRKKMGRQA